ncbi:hypothetical protein [Helicobacter canis]|uniref:hypothetical protein n=1 Tax=Helicobacter canis TaxID=29419 RepID=UPI002943BE3D|nr:hypothetical protein [Helicobacter canis]
MNQSYARFKRISYQIIVMVVIAGIIGIFYGIALHQNLKESNKPKSVELDKHQIQEILSDQIQENTRK